MELLRTLDSLVHIDDLDEIRGHLRDGAALPHICLVLIGILILLGIVLQGDRDTRVRMPEVVPHCDYLGV